MKTFIIEHKETGTVSKSIQAETDYEVLEKYLAGFGISTLDIKAVDFFRENYQIIEVETE